MNLLGDIMPVPPAKPAATTPSQSEAQHISRAKHIGNLFLLVGLALLVVSASLYAKMYDTGHTSIDLHLAAVVTFVAAFSLLRRSINALIKAAQGELLLRIEVKISED